MRAQLTNQHSSKISTAVLIVHCIGQNCADYSSFVHSPKNSTAVLIVQATTCPGRSSFKLIASFARTQAKNWHSLVEKIAQARLPRLALFPSLEENVGFTKIPIARFTHPVVKKS